MSDTPHYETPDYVDGDGGPAWSITTDGNQNPSDGDTQTLKRRHSDLMEPEERVGKQILDWLIALSIGVTVLMVGQTFILGVIALGRVYAAGPHLDPTILLWSTIGIAALSFIASVVAIVYVKRGLSRRPL